jgi:hypothetical protein
LGGTEAPPWSCGRFSAVELAEGFEPPTG